MSGNATSAQLGPTTAGWSARLERLMTARLDQETVAEILRLSAIRYLTKIPAEADVPRGHVVVHNDVWPVARRRGTRGSRAWTQPPTERLVRCDCGWAPELSEHYLSPFRGWGVER